MRKLFTLLITLVSFSTFGQIQENAPWAKNVLDQQRAAKPTLQEISDAANSYFNTIDKDKKGSGYKPFKRWEYNWSHFLKNDGTLKGKEEILKAWKEKKQLNNNSSARADVSNWQAIGPYIYSNTASWSPGKGRVNAITVDPSDSNTYYVGTPAGGIWKSTDAGVNWTVLTDDLPSIGVSGIAVHPTDSNTIYIASGDDDAGDSPAIGVWKSTDGGVNWNNTGNIPGNPNSMNEIYINPDTPETVLVATSSGVQKSTNGGAVWTTKLNGNIRDLKMKPGDTSIWYATSNSQFFRSTDSGETFSPITLPNLGVSSRLTMDVGGETTGAGYVYIVSAGSGSVFNGIYKSTDSGQSFIKTNQTSDIFQSTQAWYDLALTVSSEDPNIVYVGVLDVWKSTNGGDNFSRINQWNNSSSPSYTHADIHTMRFFDGKFFVGSDGGIYVSTDEGANFTDLTKNIANSQFYRISVSPQNYQAIAGGLQDNGGFAYKNGDWRNYHGADGMEGIVDPTNQNKYYGFIQNGSSLHISNNSGLTRSSAVGAPNNQGGDWITPMAINSDGDLYSGFTQLYKLENNAWSQISSFSFGGNVDGIEIDPNNEDNIYIFNGASLFRSTDRGVTFEFVSVFIGTINSIEVSNNDSNTMWFATSNGVYKSNNILDNAPTTTNITGNLPSDSKLTIKHHERSGNNTVYLGTSLGVYFINDDVTDWETFDNNLPNTQVRDLDIHEEDSKLIAATYGRGIFMSDIPRQLPDNDVRLLAINNPSVGVKCGNDLTPEILVKNQGVQAINTITITYSIDGGADDTFIWNGNLASETNETIAIPTINDLGLGNHNLKITTTISNDTYSSNNELEVSFLINESNNSPITTNTFEDANNVLLTETNNADVWVRGRPNKVLLSAPEGDFAYITQRATNYPDETTSYLYTNCYNLTTVSNPELAFKMAFDIENEFDYMLVEYSTNLGASWEVLGTASDPNWYNNAANLTPQGANLPGKQWTGLGETINPNDNLSNATARDYSYDLAAFTNETSIIFRFKFFADENTNEEGAVIDNLRLNGVLSVDNFNLLNNIAIYPNPSESIFNLNWNTGDALNIKVYDITGKQIFTKKNITNNSYQLDLSGYAQGIYLLNMNMNGKTATKKLILK